MMTAAKYGDRIQVMSSTIYPIEPGSKGTIINVTEGSNFTELEVRLDNRQILSVVPGIDDFFIEGRARAI